MSSTASAPRIYMPAIILGLPKIRGAFDFSAAQLSWAHSAYTLAFGGLLLGARAIQGAGAAILAPSTLALLTTGFPEGHERTRTVGLYGATAGVGAGIGLVAGGILADRLSWRAGFFINLPVGLALMVGALRCFRETERHAGRFDVVGAVSSTLGMGALVFGTVHAAEAGWTDALTLSAFVDDPGCVFDTDTPADLERASREHASRRL